jgi:hypothetical protein
MLILYSLPFYIVSIIICVVFSSWFDSIGDLNAAIIGGSLGLLSLILGTVIANRRY